MIFFSCNDDRHCIYLDNALTTGFSNATTSAKDTPGMICEKYDEAGNGLGCCSFPKSSKTQVVCGIDSITVDFGCNGTTVSTFRYDNGTGSANFSAQWSDQRGATKKNSTATPIGKGGYDPYLENKSGNGASGAYGEATATDPNDTTNQKRGMLKRMHRNIRRTEVLNDVSNTTATLSTGLSANNLFKSNKNGVDLYITCTFKTDAKEGSKKKKSSKHGKEDKKGSKKDASSTPADLIPSTGDKNSTASTGSTGSTYDLGNSGNTKTTDGGNGSTGNLYSMDGGLTPSSNSTTSPTKESSKGKTADKPKEKSSDNKPKEKSSSTPEVPTPSTKKPDLKDLNNPGYLDGAP